MKSAELRIGNWINLTKDDFKTVKPYQLDGIDIYKLDESNCADIAPIELTEDWLKRLGCIEQRINSTKKNYWNKEKDFSVDVEFSFSGNLYYYNVSKDRRKPLIHVHKLQNLHYELKDEELKIK